MSKIIFFALACVLTLRLAVDSQPFLTHHEKNISIISDTIQPTISAEDSLVYYKKNVTASYYHSKFEGKKTSSGEPYSNKKYTAAHRTFPFGTLLKVTNVANDKSVVVKVNDRGPYSKTKEIDLSQVAFLAITNTLAAGQLKVHIQEVK